MGGNPVRFAHFFIRNSQRLFLLDPIRFKQLLKFLAFFVQHFIYSQHSEKSIYQFLLHACHIHPPKANRASSKSVLTHFVTQIRLSLFVQFIENSGMTMTVHTVHDNAKCFGIICQKDVKKIRKDRPANHLCDPLFKSRCSRSEISSQRGSDDGDIFQIKMIQNCLYRSLPRRIELHILLSQNAVITGIHEGYTRYTDVRITLAFFAL